MHSAYQEEKPVLFKMQSLMNSIYDSHDPHTKANYNSRALDIVVQLHFADMMDSSKRIRLELKEIYKSLTNAEFIACCLNHAQDGNEQGLTKKLITSIHKRYIKLDNDYDFSLVIVKNTASLGQFFS